MSTTTQRRRRQVEERRQEAAGLIANQYGACRVMFSWMGTHKGLSKAQKARAADQFEADHTYLSASKKLFDTKDEKFRAVTNVKHRIRDLWERMTLPYIEDGIRLIRLEHVEAFDAAMREMAVELTEAVEDLNMRYSALKAEARTRLGSLYNPDDYVEDPRDAFKVVWDFPVLEPPDYLQFLNPGIFDRAREQFQARMEATVELAEAAFLAEFRECLAHIVERLSGNDEDGKPKVFRDSVVDNLKTFFERFRLLNLRSNPELDALVDRAKSIVGDRDPELLRDTASVRAQVASGLASVKGELDGLTVVKPRRRVVLPGQGDDGI